MIDTVKNPRYRRDAHGIAYLVLDLDGKEAELHYRDQRLYGYGALLVDVPADADHDFDHLTFVLPADPESGRPRAMRWTSATVDRRVRAHFDRFMSDYDSGRLQVGPVPNQA